MNSIPQGFEALLQGDLASINDDGFHHPPFAMQPMFKVNESPVNVSRKTWWDIWGRFGTLVQRRAAKNRLPKRRSFPKVMDFEPSTTSFETAGPKCPKKCPKWLQTTLY
jgi:hypothetical protein